MKIGLSIRRVVDGALILLLVITGWRFIDRQLSENTARAIALTPALTVGDILRLPGLSWTAPRTVVLFLSSTCPACDDNLPFYREIAAAAAPQVPVVAVSDQPEAIVTEWLREKNVPVNRIHSIKEPLSYGFTLTPMVLILDIEGRVTDLMIRRLKRSDQFTVLERIRNQRAKALDNSQQVRELSVADLNTMKSSRGVQILDVRPREMYQDGHREGARNLPFAELSARAPIEVNARVPVVVDCLQPGAAQHCRSAGWTLLSASVDEVFLLVR